VKNIFSNLYALDDKCVKMVNDAYLWALDWTGIYVGTILLINCAPGFAFLWYKLPAWMSLFFLTCVLIMACQMYWLQNSGNKIQFNAYAEMVRGAMYRWCFLGLNIGSLMADIFLNHLTLLQVLGDIDAILFWYIICIKIRDREKKKFLLPKMAYGINT